MQQLGQSVLVFGLVLVGFGLFLSLGPKIPLIGRLPGDIYVDRGNFKFYFPLTTSIVISLVFTLLINIFRK